MSPSRSDWIQHVLGPSVQVAPGVGTGAFVMGALLLAYPLTRTSRLVLQGETVMMHRSAAFFVVMIGLVIVRILAHTYLDTVMSLQQTAGLFFVLAFGTILRWRLSMLLEYKRLIGGRTSLAG